jgi:putative endopeptidase
MKSNNKKNIGIKIYIVGAIILFTMTFIFRYLNTVSNEEETKTDLRNDFYGSVNKEIIESKELESDEEYWSLMFTDTQDKIDDKKSEIINGLVENKEEYNIGTNEYKICKLYQSIINQKNNMEKLNTYIESIDSSESIEDLMENLSNVNKELSLGIFVNFNLQNDFKDNTETIVMILPYVFDYGYTNSDYYTNPLYSSYIATFIKYDREILELYGYSEEEAKESIKKVSKFYTEIANNSKSNEELKEIQSYYNIVTNEELQNIFSNIDINDFLTPYNKKYKISIADENQARALNNYFTLENIGTLKECIKLQILQNYALYADSSYYDLINRLEAELTGTDVTQDTIEDYAVDLISSYFDTEISQKYIEKYANIDAIDDFEKIILDIIEQYKVVLSENEWLSEETKEKAILKLEKMKINIGYPEKWLDVSEAYIIGDNLLDNMINMNKVYTEFENNLVINKEQFWLISPLTVNAYYNMQDNSINFPIALLDSELYNQSNSYYQNLGSIGSIIAHEITHAFDNNGALFDEKGNLNNWWQEDDYQKFEELQNEVINYYNEYKINGKSVNGKQTVGENIADLGGVSCIVSIADKKGASKEEMQELFEAYAKTWVSKSTDEYQKLLLIMDTHSPDKIRVNAVLSSINEFYDVYDITKGDGMYKENRLKIW